MNTHRFPIRLPSITNLASTPVLAASILIFSISISLSQAADEVSPQKKRKTVVIKYNPMDEETSKLVPLKTVSFQTVKRICDPLLSKKGTIAFLPERNTVIVFDKQNIVDKICQLIQKIDMPAVNIRVDVDFLESGKTRNDRLNARFGNRNNPRVNNQIRIVNGKMVPINRIAISAGKRSGTSSRNTSQFIMTKSGHAASIWAGRRIADPSWLRNYRLQPTIIVPVGGGGAIVIPGADNDIVWADIGASLYVLPRALGNDMIEVEIYPVVSYLVDEPQTNRIRRGRNRRNRRRRQSVRVENVSTKITVKSGQRVSIGGVIRSNKNFYTNLFGPDFLSRDENSSILDMYLTATIVKPGSSGLRSYIPRTPDVRKRY